jgi:hypothetical protein
VAGLTDTTVVISNPIGDVAIFVSKRRVTMFLRRVSSMQHIYEGATLCFYLLLCVNAHELTWLLLPLPHVSRGRTSACLSLSVQQHTWCLGLVWMGCSVESSVGSVKPQNTRSCKFTCTIFVIVRSGLKDSQKQHLLSMTFGLHCRTRRPLGGHDGERSSVPSLQPCPKA